MEPRSLRLKRRLRAACEWMPILAGLRLVPCLSRPALLRLARVAGDLAWLCDRRARRVACANLRVIYGHRATPRRCRAVVRAAFRHAARVVLDTAWFSRHGRSRISAWSAVSPSLEAWLDAHRPGIVVSGHLGNWEVAGQAAVVHGYPMTSVAKRLGSPHTTRRLNALRRALGQHIVLAQGAVRGLLQALRAGGYVAILQDQHTDPAEGGVWVDFLGLPAAVSSAAARLALKTGAAVAVVFARAFHDGRYRCELVASLQPDPGDGPEALTRRISDALAAAIRRHPTQWLVMYKRWKRVPPGFDAAHYPFYARPWEPPPPSAPSTSASSRPASSSPSA